MLNIKKYKFLLIFILAIITTLLPLTQYSSAEENDRDQAIQIHFFYGDGCPHCEKEKEFLETLDQQFTENIEINEYEVYYNQEDIDVFTEATKQLGIQVAGVPLTIIGDQHIVGFGSANTTGSMIEMMIKNCIENGCPNIIRQPENQMEETKTTQEDEVKESIMINTYIFGEFDLKSVSLPIATIVIAFVDGFNPCAMWILIFLITMLINLEDRRKLYILGTVFIITSGVVYFGFLAAWFNLFKFIGYAYWLKVIIGIVAIISGYIHIKNGLFSKGECHVTNLEQRKSISERIKKALNEKNFGLSILGIIMLAISVNFIEVVCSAGLPAVYTNLLSTINLSFVEYYMYLLLYVIIFMIDDLLVFFIAVKTLEVTGITKKYSKWSSLIGGILIFIIGILLIFKPELLMFG
jgi:glutaredoxin